MKQWTTIIAYGISALVLTVGITAHAQNQLVTCTKSNCNFNDLMIQIKTLINFAFVYLVIPIMIFLVCKAGFIYLTSGGDPGAHKKARGIFFNAIIGFLIALCAWVLIKVLIEYLNNGAEFKVDTFF